MAMPLVQIASIGTQVSEAFAGLDRIREIREMATEDQADATKAGDARHRRPRRVPGRDVRVRRRTSEVLKHVSFSRRRRIDDGARRLERRRKEHADRPRDGVQPSEERPRARRRKGRRERAAARLPLARRRRDAGQLPVRRHDQREHRVQQARRDRTRRFAPRRTSRTATSSSSGSRRATTRSSASAA